MLILTNGDSAADAIQAAGIAAEVLPWRDVLHDGPVPARLSLSELSSIRARFIADCGWGPLRTVRDDFRHRNARLAAFAVHDEAVLWFEHDLYDQLQLLQLLHWLDGRDRRGTQLSIRCEGDFLADLPLAELPGRFAERLPLTDTQLNLGAAAWDAFRDPLPADLLALLEADTDELPFLHAALKRLLQEYPHVDTGLSRTEHQILRLVQSHGPIEPPALFRANQGCEAVAYLGDASFWRFLADLSSPGASLIQQPDGTPVRTPEAPAPGLTFLSQRLVLTDLGRRVLAGQTDRLQHHPLDRWIGGVHLRPGHYWRWNGQTVTARA